MDRGDFAYLVNHDQSPVEFKDWGPRRIKRFSKAEIERIQRDLRIQFGNPEIIFISPPCAGHSRPRKGGGK